MEVFYFLGYAWDIERAWGIIGARKPNVRVRVRGLAALREMIEVDTEYAETADLKRPLILVPLPDAWGDFVVDGWHRVHRAALDHVETLPGHLLTYPEARRVCKRGRYEDRRPRVERVRVKFA